MENSVENYVVERKYLSQCTLTELIEHIVFTHIQDSLEKDSPTTEPVEKS